MRTSRLSRRGRVTIPEEVRKGAGMGPGDLVVYEARDGAILLKRLDPFDAVFHTAISETLDEWASPEDAETFRDL